MRGRFSAAMAMQQPSDLPAFAVKKTATCNAWRKA